MALSRFRYLQLFAFVAALLAFQSGAAYGQSGRPRQTGAFTEIKWDSYTFKFVAGNQMAQVLDANGQVIGTILSMQGELQVLPTVTGVDAEKLKKSFEAWKAQGGEKALNSGAPAPSSGRAAREGGAGAREGGPAPKAAASAAPVTARNSDGTPSASPPTAPATATAGFKYGILDAAGLEKLGKGAAIRLDLNLLRLEPELLDQKLYMRYFIALNNCTDQNVAKMLDNELDYPDLAALYQPKAAEILGGLPMSAGVALYGEGGLWKKLLTLGEYDKSKGSFPILYPGQADGAEIPSTISFDFGRSEYRATCAIANKVLSSRNFGAMPPAYSISIKPMAFKDFPIDEAGARKYIQNPGGSQRSVILLVDIHLLDAPPTIKKSGSAIANVNFSGEVARVRVAKAINGEPIGILFDNHSLPNP
jgi:hypothetical protein